MRSVLSVSLPEKMAVELDVLAKETGRDRILRRNGVSVSSKTPSR